MRILNFIGYVVILGCLFSSCTKKNSHLVNSPNGAVQLSVNETGGSLKYELRWQDELIIDSSTLSILPNAPVKIMNEVSTTHDSIWRPTWGQFSEIRDHYNELVLNLTIDGANGKLIARTYNSGIGFRFELEADNANNKIDFYCEYNLKDQDVLYFTAGESEPKGPISVESLSAMHTNNKNMPIPILVETQNKKYLSILESDLYSSKGFNTMKVLFNASSEKLISSSTHKPYKGRLTTPWKVLLLGEQAGDLVTNTVPVNLATPCQIENTDWIKPGKTLWDWRVHGFTAPDGFVYGINTESYKRFIDFAADKNIRYFMIDDAWYTSASNGHFELSDNLDLQAVINYAAKRNVELILYYDRKKGEYGDKELFPYYQSLGMKGIKYGFMGNNTDFSRDAIRMSAQSNLLIDFHDSPVPFTGVRRTYPNAITREYCHAQQDSRRAFTPETFIKMALINAIQGPLDMNNGNFDLQNINKGQRQKGPRKKYSYYSTVASEAARTLIIFSGLVCLPDAPEAYDAKADLFEFIQAMPVGKWDESKVLNSKIGEYITTARRHGKEWFIGSVINQQGGTLDINLDFLDDAQRYEATFYEDSKDTNCRTNPEAYQIRKAKVSKGQTIHAKLAPGGGHCMWITPL